MKRLSKSIASIALIITLIFTTFGSAKADFGLSCPIMYGIFNETTLDQTIVGINESLISGYVTDYKTNATFSNVQLTRFNRRLALSYSLKNTNGLEAVLFFTDITPLLGRTVVTKCVISRGPGYFSIRITPFWR